MRCEKRKVCLLLDNFSGHSVTYQPKNVEVHFFQPNLTSHVQPCDAGIIRCLKAHYRRFLCLRALELEEAGEQDIYEIDVLSSMRLLEQAWNEVTPETIKNCWKHTGICPDNANEQWEDIDDGDSDVKMTEDSDSSIDLHWRSAWQAVMAYALDELTHHEAEDRIKTLLGEDYNPIDWQGPLNSVMECEDKESAIEVVNSLIPNFDSFPSKSSISTSKPSQSSKLMCPHLRKAEEDFMECVEELKRRKLIKGDLPSIDDLIDPQSERSNIDSEETDHWDDGDKGLRQIVDWVRSEMDGSEKPEATTQSDDEGDEENKSDSTDYAKALEAAEFLGRICSQRGDLENAFELGKYLRRFRGELRREQEDSLKQVSIEHFFDRT
jgi:hypothetical protein